MAQSEPYPETAQPSSRDVVQVPALAADARQLRAWPEPASHLRAAVTDGVRSVYQPMVDIETGEMVAFEALARGPVDSLLKAPAALFEAARRSGALAQLDRACCDAALRGAMDGGLRAPAAVFVNVEPEVIDVEIFFEITERALTSRPAELLETVERIRAAGFGIALDDVGADRGSLALLPLLRPDVVKLDMSLVHNHPSRRSGEVMNGVCVCAYAEQTGATIVAEGVETDATCSQHVRWEPPWLRAGCSAALDPSRPFPSCVAPRQRLDCRRGSLREPRANWS